MKAGDLFGKAKVRVVCDVRQAHDMLESNPPGDNEILWLGSGNEVPVSTRGTKRKTKEIDYDKELEAALHKPAFGWFDGCLGMTLGIFIKSLFPLLVALSILAAVWMASDAVACKLAGVPFDHWFIFRW